MIYCSPLVDPYQPAEETGHLMPRIMDELLLRPPRVFVIQTRGPLIVRDLARLVELSRRTTLRVSFSITTNRESVRKIVRAALRDHRLPIESDPGAAASRNHAPSRRSRRYCPAIPRSWRRIALDATDQDIIGDPSACPIGEAARRNHARGCVRNQRSAWLFGVAGSRVSARGSGPDCDRTVRRAGRRFATGTEGFGWLAQ